MSLLYIKLGSFFSSCFDMQSFLLMIMIMTTTTTIMMMYILVFYYIIVATVHWKPLVNYAYNIYVKRIFCK